MLSYSPVEDLGYTADNGLVPADGEMLFTSCRIGIEVVSGVARCADNNSSGLAGLATRWYDSDGFVVSAKVTVKVTDDTTTEWIWSTLSHEVGHGLGHKGHPPSGTDSVMTEDSELTSPGSYDAQGLQAALANQKDDPPGTGGGPGGGIKRCKGKGKKKRRCLKRQKKN